VRAGPLDTSRSTHARLHPLALDGAVISDGFWADRRRLNRERLIPDGARQLEAAGNLHNLRAAAGREDGPFRGLVFMDSDVYKWLEAVGWELANAPSRQLAAQADEVIDVIAAAQDENGYLNSYYQVAQPRERFSNLAWDHELYCCGHLIQAAVAHARGRGEETLLAVARRFADHLDAVFGPGRRAGTPGHPELETALVELYRLTGERRYLELAGFFVDQRGQGLLQPASFGASYFPDHVPVREQTEIAGHAVRALYLAAGVTDLYLETGEPRLLEVMRAQWEDMAGTKTYLTGGVGAHHADEAFGDAYELPPDRCYGETCAAIASILWNWRMLLATGEARHADLVERTLYNGFLAGLALDGDGYSYVNPLQVREAPRPGRARRAAPRVVRVRVLPAQRDAAAGQPARLPGHRRRPRPAGAPVRGRDAARRSAGAARPYRLSVGRPRRDRGRGDPRRAVDAEPARSRLVHRRTGGRHARPGRRLRAPRARLAAR
jgi:DUF1680 family protein